MKKALATLATVCLLTATGAFAKLDVDTSNGMLSISSTAEGVTQKVIAKIMAPDDRLIVEETYEGSSFAWTPPAGANGAYRYDVRVVTTPYDAEDGSEAKKVPNNESASIEEYAGGSVEVRDGEIEQPGAAHAAREK